MFSIKFIDFFIFIQNKKNESILIIDFQFLKHQFYYTLKFKNLLLKQTQ